MKSYKHNSLELVKKALWDHKGFITHAAKALGVTHQAVSKRIKQNPELQEELKWINEAHLDNTESKLHEAIEDKNMAAIIWHLKCKGKSRGYIENPAMDKTGITININTPQIDKGNKAIDVTPEPEQIEE